MSYQTEVLADSPVGYWRCNDASGTLTDSSGNGRDLSDTSGITYSVDGLIASDSANKSVSLNGSSDYAKSTGYTGPSSSPFSVEMWVKPSIVTGDRDAVSNGSWKCGVSGSKWVFTTIGILDYNFTAGPTVDTAYHVVFVFKTDQDVDLYLDGEFSETKAGTGEPGGGSVVSLGATNGVTRFWAGVVDEVAIYDSALSAGRIAAHYAAAVASATQVLLASADSVDGAWTDQAGGSSLAAAIDEATADNADYIHSELSPSNSGCRVKLAAGGDPASSTGHTIKWRVGKNAAGGQTINMTVKLYQGGGDSQGAGTLIATFSRNGVTDTITEYTETLSGGEADSITDYSDLYLEFFANAT